mmetsp:Transcript_39271/g.77236  ORF Transcript_39271/g.77236 Transcript_39271/m.77236 type:complete len:356 (+) Transcript_39271:35-1102(+)|eukprot:CAMPEP_0175138336 /NCGR_PEP_ID=MMETSP0087-20121206/10292_1 /TAXON_ID=136419 /ORGANISM="Unknown Unknown, Strain D1" /LENGTH=355 /DNA_ID=CAMNT_0016421227 /DNA_START=29 /DNA_END=1096 /DNA_ORIENTATION=+
MSDKKKKSKKEATVLPAHVEQMRTRVTVGEHAVVHGKGFDAADAFRSLGFDNSLRLDKFRENLQIKIIEKKEDKVVFDVVGVDAAIANALRRILLAEIPTMAIEVARIFQNTSIIQDEVLAHRLGLVPIFADPRMFQTVEETKDGVHNEHNTIVFTLDVACSRNTKALPSAPVEEQFINAVVYSKDLVWVPQGDQLARFGNNPPRPVHDDIIIAKLRPGQSIEVECRAQKGIGQTHAKWSPVCTASYRLMPDVVLNQTVTGDQAAALVDCCPMKVFDIEDMGNEKKAVVSYPRNCTMCRECVRLPEVKDLVTLQRVRDHYIFSIESTGIYKPTELFREAIKVLMNKCDTVLQHLS